MKWIVSITVLIGIWIIWRYTSVARGIRKRDERIFQLVDPIGNKLDAGETVTPDEIRRVAELPHARHILYNAIRSVDRSDLLPKQFDNLAEQAASALAYWMMHPNELQEAPHKMELVKTVQRPDERGELAHYFVFKYHMPEGHWAEKDGWLLGVSGPLYQNKVPYRTLPDAFSRVGDKYSQTDPETLIDWYIGIQKS